MTMTKIKYMFYYIKEIKRKKSHPTNIYMKQIDGKYHEGFLI